MPAMYLAGLPIPGTDVLELARLVDDTRLADRLETAYGNGARILALEIAERETILRALEDRGAAGTPDAAPRAPGQCLRRGTPRSPPPSRRRAGHLSSMREKCDGSVECRGVQSG